MAGFFEIEDTQIIRGDEVSSKKGSHASFANANCDTCGLYTQCNSPKLKPSGEGQLGILIVGETPGKEADDKGVQLLGRTFRHIVEDLDLDLNTHFWITTALRCEPPHDEGKDRNPSPMELAACRKRLMSVIEEYKPKVIILLGKYAVDGLIGHRLMGRIGNKMSAEDWAGCQIPDQELGIWLCPTWSPSYIAAASEDPVVERQVKSHLKAAIKLAGVPFPKKDYLAQCFPIYDVKDAINIIRDCRMSRKDSAFDYETTGRKPYRAGHRIVTASISDGEQAYGFPFFNDPDFLTEWWKYLMSPKQRKTAHGSKFESIWTRVILGYWPVIQGDTCLGAHSLHNKKPNNLKFLTYIHFGVMGYDAEIDPYLEAPKQQEELFGANAFNLIDQAPKDKLVLYNAGDSLFTNLEDRYQIATLSEDKQRGLAFMITGARRLAEAEYNGLCLDEAHSAETRAAMDEKTTTLEAEIRRMPELKLWDRPKPFRVSADNDLTHLLFDLMKYEATVFTTGKNPKPKADKDTMEKIDEPIVRKVLEWKKWKKARDTYLLDFLRESVDGVMHPFFNLNIVDTYRSSSDSPNFQNIPKRQKEIMKMLRVLLKPHPGHRLIEYDFKGVEVSISACYHKDSNMIKYIEDPTTDMHRDTGCDIYMKTKDQLTKAERQVAKNAFVFPEFYGSYFEQVAPDIWNDSPPDSIAHLKSNGIRNMKDFTKHIQEIENIFWGERFPVYAEWKKKYFKDYQKKGYVDLFTGFRCEGPMRKNQVVNYPIQGTAFHCLLYTLIHVMDEMERLGLQSRTIGQIHDADINSVHPDEEKIVDYLIWYWGTQKIREDWDWINVPLGIEKSYTAVDGTWAEMDDGGLLKFKKGEVAC